MQNTYKPIKRTMGDSTGFDQGTEFPVLVSEKVIRTYRVMVDNTLESPQELRWAVQCLYNATEDDEVVFHVSSYGGSVDSLQTLLHAKNSTKAYTHTVATGSVASCAAIFLCDQDSYELDLHCGVLLHSVSFGNQGKTQDMVDISEFIHKQSKHLLEYYTVGVLTPDEIYDIVKNKRELWLTAQEFDERMQRKSRCRLILQDLVSERGITQEEASTQKYVELMIEALAIDEAQQSKPKKRTPRAKKPSQCSNSCC